MTTTKKSVQKKPQKPQEKTESQEETNQQEEQEKHSSDKSFGPVNADRLEALDDELGAGLEDEMDAVFNECEKENDIDPEVTRVATNAMKMAWLTIGGIMERKLDFEPTMQEEADMLGDATYYLISEKFPQLLNFDGPWGAFFGTIGLIYGPKIIDRTLIKRKEVEDEEAELSSKTKDSK